MLPDIGAICFHQYWCNIGNVGQCCIILPQYWRNIAFIGQFVPICPILDQYYANIACYTGRSHYYSLLRLARTTIISGMSKATSFEFCTACRAYTHIHRIDRNKWPLKVSTKVAVGVLRDSRNVSEHPYIRRIARSSLR